MLLAVIILGCIAIIAAAVAVGSLFYSNELEAHNVAMSAEILTLRAELAHVVAERAKLWRAASAGIGGVRRQLERFPGGADALAEDDSETVQLDPPKAGEDDTRDLWRTDQGHDTPEPRL